MTPTPAVSAKEKALRDRLADLIDEVAEVRGEHPSDHAVLQNADEIADAVLKLLPAALSATEGEAEPVAWQWRHCGDKGWRLSWERPFNPGIETKPLYASPPSAPAGVKDALCWAMDEIDTLSNKLRQFAYPQGMAMLNRADQLPNYEAAIGIRSSLQPDTQAAAASAPAGDLELASASVRPEPCGVEPVMWQVRMRPTWDTASPWSQWRERTKECAERIASRATSGDWESEARALAPTAITVPPQALEDSKAPLADANSIASAPAQEGRADVVREFETLSHEWPIARPVRAFIEKLIAAPAREDRS